MKESMSQESSMLLGWTYGQLRNQITTEIVMVARGVDISIACDEK
jgi:hypothetical protein